jgi:arsenate reductase-like glutaredoxin family protein
MQEFRKITDESQKLYEDLISKQEISINELKNELSSKDSYENIRLLNEQSEERIQSKIIFQNGLMIFSASFISLVISYFLNR